MATSPDRWEPRGATELVAKGLTVRETEALVRRLREPNRPTPARSRMAGLNTTAADPTLATTKQ